MTPAEATYRVQTTRLRRAYATALQAERSGGDTTPAWRAFAQQMKLVLQWVDVTKASALRARATGKKLSVPQLLDPGYVQGEKPLNLDQLVAANPWLRTHGALTEDRIDQLVEFISGKERQYGQTWVQSKRAKRDNQLIPMHRLEMFYRQAVKETATNSEQHELDDPEISDRYPFVFYHTKDDRRVRPTHALMHGFLACRWREDGVAIMRIISPPAGYNCRCEWRMVTVSEAKGKGWMGKGGVPLFAYKWPNRQAQWNFDHGTFPDPGWGSERNRYVAAPQRTAVNKTWQQRYREAGGKIAV
jgi:SPP1 gp7 family putative phage head morphogenesis protein